jgi:hypothetical protein
MADSKEKVIALISTTTSVDLNGGTGTETNLYVNPTGSGKTFVPLFVVIRQMSANATSAVVTFGITGGNCDEFATNVTPITLSDLDATANGEYGVVYMDQATSGTLQAGRLVDAGENFGVEITTAAGIACTCTMECFGYLY